MTYKWTLDYIDSITWPTIKGLLAAIKEYPPSDLLLGAVFKSQEKSKNFDPKKVPASLPIKRGKVGVVVKK